MQMNFLDSRQDIEYVSMDESFYFLKIMPVRLVCFVLNIWWATFIWDALDCKHCRHIKIMRMLSIKSFSLDKGQMV